MFDTSNPKIRSLFRNSHIKRRFLVLPEPLAGGGMPDENPKQLTDKHREHGVKIGVECARKALYDAGTLPEQVDQLVVASSTGFLCPGFTAYLIKTLGMRDNTHRVDLLGMGCVAGVNALQPAWSFVNSTPGSISLVVCIEVCSAAYVFDETMRTAVVNSLFGDGAAAAVMRSFDGPAAFDGPRIMGFESYIATDLMDSMYYEMVGGKLSFFLHRDIPYRIGDNVEEPVDRLLSKAGLRRRDVDHWVVHSGGKKVIDSLKYNLGITTHDVRHTLAVLENYGNVSSGSFMFSLKKLMEEGITKPGDIGVIIAMGPGTSIETALLCW